MAYLAFYKALHRCPTTRCLPRPCGFEQESLVPARERGEVLGGTPTLFGFEVRLDATDRLGDEFSAESKFGCVHVFGDTHEVSFGTVKGSVIPIHCT